ncbi:unnamed protein product [Adineta ricciae]|uniref:Uncharacterized protein n=1 Tax=Adineta ricciae TaxID=249248 RepID=A0A814EN81_ADIRI|nr:unnamed protein product [Adineta ricciae]CAF1070527.1 unnamed protein product [Adineta ricciae]
MTYHIKKEHLKNWDIQQRNDNRALFLTNDYDEEDIYISERSSITSSNDTCQLISADNERIPTATSLSPRLASSRKTPHSLRYTYNDLPANGIPMAVQFQKQQKEEKTKKKTLHKAPPGHGTLASLPQVKPTGVDDNYYPYWYYYKLKNPDWIARQRQANHQQKAPYNLTDPSKYPSQLSLTTLPIKPKKRTPNSRPNGVPVVQSKQHHDHSEKDSVTPSNVVLHQDHGTLQQRPTSRRYVPLKDPDNHGYYEQQVKRKVLPDRRKLKTEYEWTDHYLQSISNKPPQNPSNLIITSKPIANRSKLQSKNTDKHFFTSDMDDDDSYYFPQHHHHHHNPAQQNRPHVQTHHHHLPYPPSIPSESNHLYHRTTLQNISHQDEYHQQHLHIRRRSSSGTYIDSDVQVVDILYDDPYPHTSTLYNQIPYLPAITNSHQQKAHVSRYPVDYYGALSQLPNSRTYKQTTGKTKTYKPKMHSRFSDHHMQNVIDKRLVV